MGKASERRKKSRREFLNRLAKTDPGRFQEEWTKRLESWGEQVKQEVNIFVVKDGRRVGSVFRKVDHVLTELAACGEQAMSMEAKDTKEVLTAACCKAVALAVDIRLYRLNNNEQNYQAMKGGTHRPPR